MKSSIKFLLFLFLLIPIQAGQWKIIDRDSLYHDFTNGSSNAHYLGINCFDSLNCIAVGNYGIGDYAEPMVRQTTDGGKSWKTAFVDSIVVQGTNWIMPNCATIYASSDPSTCLIGLDSNKIFYSNDSLKTWKKIQLNDSHVWLGCDVFNSKFAAINTALNIFITSDSGKSFQRTNIYDSVLKGWRMRSMRFLDSNVIYAVMYFIDSQNNVNYSVFRSNDRAQNWTRLHDFSGVINNLKIVDSNNIWVIGDGGDIKPYNAVIKHSTDGGKFWWTVLDTHTTNDGGIIDITIRKNRVLAINLWFWLLYSTDGGNHWVKDTTFNMYTVSGPCNGIAFLNDHVVLAASDAFGRIYKKDYDEPDFVDEFNNEASNFNYFFPNPASDYISINLDNHTPRGVVADVMIFDIFGQEVPPRLTSSAIPQDGYVRIDVSALPPGVYFVRVGNKMQKFIKY